MTHRRLALPLLIALLALPASAQASDRTKNTDKTLRADLVRLAKAAGGTGGFTVLDGATGRIVAESGGNTARPLGSTAKLLTTGAALLQRRVTHLSTAALTAAPLDPATGTLGGDLILRGGGDPLLDEAKLQQVADEVQARGIKVITGAVVGDGSAFDALTGGPATAGAFDLNFAGSIGALTSPVYAPDGFGCMFCAPSPIGCPSSSAATAASAVNGGQMTTSTPEKSRAPDATARRDFLGQAEEGAVFGEQVGPAFLIPGIDEVLVDPHQVEHRRIVFGTDEICRHVALSPFDFPFGRSRNPGPFLVPSTVRRFGLHPEIGHGQQQAHGERRE